MRLNNAFTQRKAKTQAAPCIAAGFARSVKHIENFVFHIIGYTVSVVGNAYNHPVCPRRGRKAYMRSGRCIFHSIIQQVYYNLNDKTRIHIRHKQLIAELNTELVLTKLPVCMRNGLAEHIVQKLRLSVFYSAAAFHACYAQKVFHKVYQPLCIIVHRCVHLPSFILGKLIVHEQRSGAGYVGKRCAQIVRYRTQEICP